MHNKNIPAWKLRVQTLCLLAVLGIAALGLFDVIRYLLLGNATALAVICFVELVFVLLAAIAWQSAIPLLLLGVAIPAIVLGSTMNYLETTLFHFGYFLQAGIAIIVALVGSALALRRGERPHAPRRWTVVLTALLLVAALLIWLVGTVVDSNAQEVRAAIWSVPAQLTVVCERSGTVEEIRYQTKAYATDERAVEKVAYVYLPYGYDACAQYPILYLMHGTGDDASSWLLEHEENKNMVDQMIAAGVIEPLIIVTPSFYVEDDCRDALDILTYSFAQELRNDLMPVVESSYASYAESCDEQGFAASRDYRAFAGLSRGAVTTYHSAFCASLDYFSWFGTFSGSRTDADYYRKTIQSEAFAAYPIHYLYISSGSFDFALPRQIQDYQTLTAMEPRLIEGENTSFDIFPMRYHSWGNWNLALYNFLQKIF